MSWNAIWSSGNSSIVPAGVRGFNVLMGRQCSKREAA
jgi:hypothetical protein